MHQTKLTLRPSSSQRLAESPACKPAQEPFCHHDNEKEGHEPSEQVPLYVGDDLGVGTHLIKATPLVRDLAIHNAPDRYTRHSYLGTSRRQAGIAAMGMSSLEDPVDRHQVTL